MSTPWTNMHKICMAFDCETDIIDTQTLEKYKSQVNQNTINGSTPLHFVALGTNVQLATWLIENGAEFILNDELQSPLHWACKRGYLPMIKLLLTHIPTNMIRQTDDEGNTAYDWTVEYEHKTVSRIIKSAGSNQKSKKKYTAAKIWSGVLSRPG
mmetsp:Transcript_41170/g.63444  ORF Transcript_41170/g.63444 Transcript_41170/m.63444 type:complete len:155 (-) Transcript_41170:16-480(-)